MIKTAYLRVYIPESEATFSVMRLPAAGVGPAGSDRAGRYGIASEPLHNDVLVIEAGGERYLCPRHPHLRMLEGVLAFRNAYLGVGGGLVVPETTALLAADELERLKDREPETRSHILTSAWYIPLRWFAAFDPEERSYVPEASAVAFGDPAPSVTYRTPVFQAVRRLRAAVHVLRSVELDDSVVGEIEDLIDWLSDFSRHAIVELDYGSLTDMFSPWELAEEDTASHVVASLAALRQHDLERAGLEYQSAVEPWAHWMFLTSAN